MSNFSGFSLACCLIMTTVVISSFAEESSLPKPRPVSRSGPWSMNSIGYNAGLEGLRKLFGKRTDKMGQDYVGELRDNLDPSVYEEFLQFLTQKNNKLWSPAIVRCILSEALVGENEK